jgi:DNA-binding LacI/PurR family transcriptional regulator
MAELPLTTVRQPHAEKGRTAVQMLTAPYEPGERVFDTELIVRASTGAWPPR